MDILLIILGILCLIVGLAGCILPMIPGPPVAYAGLLLLHFTDKAQFSTTQLLYGWQQSSLYRYWIISSRCWAANTAEAVGGERAAAS